MTEFVFCRLLPPRASFAADMTENEAAAMQAHGAYWRGLADKGQAVLFGLVADPAGPFGVGVLRLADGAEARAITAADPAIAANIGLRYEIFAMPFATLGTGPG